MKRHLMLAITVLLMACGAPETQHDGVVVDTVAAPDGVPIVYDARGQGDPTLVFIHCWACDRTFWKEQLDAFATDHRVVSLDLGGHGQSGTGRAQWTLASLGGDVAAVIEALDLDRVILVGHSMGGPVALETARLVPDRVRGVACVDTLHDVELVYTPEEMRQYLDPLEADFAGAMAMFTRMTMPEDADTTLINWIAAKAAAADPDVALALMRDMGAVNEAELLAAVSVPVRCINATPPPAAIPETAIETNRKYGDYDAVFMDDVGHFLMLERPAAFNGHLAEVLADLQAAGQAMD